MASMSRRDRRVLDSLLPVTDHQRGRLAERRYGDEEWKDRDLARYESKWIDRPIITWGPFHFFDIPASATTDSVLMLPTAAATLATTSLSQRAPKAGRVVGYNGLIGAAVSSGSLRIQVKIEGAYTTVGGDSFGGGETTAQDWLGWHGGIPFEERAAIKAALLSASLSPTTLEARVTLYLMLDVDEGRRS